MTIFRDISVVWSLFHVLILFIMLFESRYSKRTTILATFCIMGPLALFQVFLLLWLGPVKMAQLLLFTATIPSLFFFWFMSKNRDGRFFFTFCLCDTLSAEILMITNLMDYYLFGNQYISMFIIRLVAFPLLEIFIWRMVRPIFWEVQRSVKQGWTSFAVVSAIFYLTLILLGSVPNAMTDRPAQIPAIILVMTLMPLMYINIFQALRRQQKIFKMVEQDNILQMQVQHMQMRIEQFAEADEKFRIERHDMRHKLRTIEEMLNSDRLEELRGYLHTAEQRLEETKLVHYCANPILDAVLTSYLGYAEELGIRINADLSIPEELSVDVTELSTVFANAIENAVSACERLPLEKRVIDIRARTHPQFMFSIVNPYNGKLLLDEKGIPMSTREGHGFGTRSIIAFCDKYNAFYEFKVEKETFDLRITMDA